MKSIMNFEGDSKSGGMGDAGLAGKRKKGYAGPLNGQQTVVCRESGFWTCFKCS